jgi:hypothetical protein
MSEGVPQKDPAVQFPSSVEWEGQYDPGPHWICRDVFGQNAPARHGVAAGDPGGQYWPRLEQGVRSPPVQKCPSSHLV